MFSRTAQGLVGIMLIAASGRAAAAEAPGATAVASPDAGASDASPTATVEVTRGRKYMVRIQAMPRIL